MAVRNSWWSVSNAQTSCSARSHPATWSNRRARWDSSRSPGVPMAPAITAPSKPRCWSRPGTRTAVSGSRRRPTRTRSARSSSSCVRCRGSFSEFDAGESDCAHPNETHLWCGAASTGRRPPRATQFAATEVSPAVADEYRRVVAAAGLGLAASTAEAEKLHRWAERAPRPSMMCSIWYMTRRFTSGVGPGAQQQGARSAVVNRATPRSISR